MRAKKYLYFAEWLNVFMIVMLIYTGAEWVFCTLNIGVNSIPLLVLLLFIVLFSYFIRVYTENIIIFIALHLTAAVIMFFLPLSLPYKIIGIVIFAAFSISDFIFWAGEGIRSYVMVNPVGAAVMLLVFAYASYHQKDELIKISYFCGILFIAMFFLRTYLVNAVKLASDMQVNRTTPLEEMFRNNGWIVLVLVLTFTVFMLFVQSDALASGLNRFIHFISSLIRRVILFVLSHLSSNEVENISMDNESFKDLDLGPLKSYPTWLITFFQALEKVLTFAMVIGAIYLVLKSIAAFVRIYFSRHGYNISMTNGEDYIDVKERIRHVRSRRLRRFSLPADERERVRRRYKREVEDMRRGGYKLNIAHTPRERARDVDKEDFGKLTEKYENLRYGKE